MPEPIKQGTAAWATKLVSAVVHVGVHWVGVRGTVTAGHLWGSRI